MKINVLCLFTALAALPGAALASPTINEFAVFGGSKVSLGNGTQVGKGLVGGNNKVTVGGTSTTLSVQGGGALSAGNGDLVSGPIVFNGDVTIGGTGVVNGDIDSGGKVTLGNGVTVNGSIRATGKVSVGGGSTVTGNIDSGVSSGQAVQLNNNTQVQGTVKHMAGTTVGAGSGTTMGANVTGTPAAPQAFAPVVLPAASLFSAGTVGYDLGGTKALSLGAGSYKDILLGNNSTLTLTAGNYYFHNWELGGSTSITLDVSLGDIALFFTGNVELGNGVVASVVGGDAGDVYAEVLGHWEQGGGGLWSGTVFASGLGSDINFGNGSTINGAVWARDELEIGGNSQVNYMLADRLAVTGSALAADVPEPASLALVGAGLLAAIGVRRRKVATAA